MIIFYLKHIFVVQCNLFILTLKWLSKLYYYVKLRLSKNI